MGLYDNHPFSQIPSLDIQISYLSYLCAVLRTFNTGHSPVVI